MVSSFVAISLAHYSILSRMFTGKGE
jgi:hypothetical protein